jgi:hypothetical protein
MGFCNSTGRCQVNYNSTTDICKISEGNCDISERCSGSSLACPTDSFNSSSTICRENRTECDMTEYCSGNNANCPEDKNKADNIACSNGGACTNGICVVSCTDDTGCSSAGLFCDAVANRPFSCAKEGNCLKRTNLNPCTATEECLNGACQPKAECSTDDECSEYNGNFCDDIFVKKNTGYCNLATGKCEVRVDTLTNCALQDNLLCEGTNLMQENYTCDSYTFTCKVSKTTVKNCNDGKVCTVGDTCSNNQCISGTPRSCSDGIYCTDDSCIEPSGCINILNDYNCNTGDICTENDCVADSCSSCEDCDNRECTYDLCKGECNVDNNGCYFTGSESQSCVPLYDACYYIDECSDYSKEECYSDPCYLGLGCTLDGYDQCIQPVPQECGGTDTSCGNNPYNCQNCNLLDGCSGEYYYDYHCKSGECVPNTWGWDPDCQGLGSSNPLTILIDWIKSWFS